MAKHEVQVHEIEYLAASSATIGAPPNEQKVVVLTVRPDEDSYRPHNLSISRQQAERLLEDLKAILRSAVCLLLLLAVAGCSGEVEIEEETTTTMSEIAVEPSAHTVTKERTRVAIDLLADHGPLLPEEGRAVEALDGALAIEGCLHIHETLIIHLNENDRAALPQAWAMDTQKQVPICWNRLCYRASQSPFSSREGYCQSRNADSVASSTG